MPKYCINKTTHHPKSRNNEWYWTLPVPPVEISYSSSSSSSYDSEKPNFSSCSSKVLFLLYENERTQRIGQVMVP